MASRKAVPSAAALSVRADRLAMRSRRLTSKIDLASLGNDGFLSLCTDLSGLSLGGPSPPWSTGRGVEKLKDLLGRVFVARAGQEEEGEGESRHVERGHVCTREDPSSLDALAIEPFDRWASVRVSQIVSSRTHPH
jgi:hypothetical protein